MRHTSLQHMSTNRPRAGARRARAAAMVAICLTTAFVGMASASAQTSGTWTTAGNGAWSTTSNWADGIVAGGAGSIADFSTIDITAKTVVTVGTQTSGRLIFGDTNWTSGGSDWELFNGTLTMDNTGGDGGNPPTITAGPRLTSFTALLAGTNGLNLALPRSNYDSTRGTSAASGNGAATQTAGTLRFTANNTLSGPLAASGGIVQMRGGGSFGSATALSVTGNGQFENGDTNRSFNNGRTNRIGDGTATLSLGGATGAGTFSMPFPAADNTHSQTFAGLTVNAGQNILNTVGSVSGTNNLIFTGSTGAGYERNTNGLVNVVTLTGFNPQFTNAPTAAGGSSVSGTDSDATLIGAILNGNDFIAAASGNFAAATYDTTLTAGKNVNVAGALATSGNLAINSLRFGENAARTVSIAVSDTLTIASGGILIGAAVATTGNTITGGSITAGQNDLWIYANGTGLNNPLNGNNALTIASKITGGISVTVGGQGSTGIGQQVDFTNSSNDYAGGTYLTRATLSVAADGVLGSTTGAVTAVSGLNYLSPSAGFTFDSARNFVVNSGAALFIAGKGQTNTIAGQLSGGGQFGPGYESSGDRLILTGNNSGFTGQYMVNGYLNATESTSLSSNANLVFTGRDQLNLGVLETSGTFSRTLGSGAGQVQWQNQSGYAGGGFAAVGGALTVNIGGNVTPDTLTWGSGYFLPQNGALNLGTTVSTDDLTFLNPIALNGAQRRINVSAAGTTNATISGELSGNASSGITKGDTGTLVLTGNNTYSGTTTVNQGTLQIGSGSTTGALSSASLITGSAGATLAFNRSNTITQGTDFNSLISGGINVRQLGSGTLVLNGANTYDGTTAIDAGTLQIGNGSTTGGLSSSSAISVASGATLAFNRTDAYGGNFANAISGSGGITLLSGSLTFATAKTYSGPTTVAGGVLVLGAAGSFAESSAIIVGNAGSSEAVLDLTAKTAAFSLGDVSQLLGGGGTVRLASSGTLNVLGTFSPGNSPGLFTFDAGTTVLSGTTFMEILGTSRATDPSHGPGFYDAVNVINSGTLQFGGILTLEFSSLFDNNTTFDLFTPASGSSLTGNFAGVTVIGGHYTGLDWNQTGGVWKSSNTTGGQSLEFSSVTGQLVIVPEPGAIALAGIGIALAAWAARRRK
jgi:fibronectin-binding autotransporter adhesin